MNGKPHGGEGWFKSVSGRISGSLWLSRLVLFSLTISHQFLLNLFMPSVRPPRIFLAGDRVWAAVVLAHQLDQLKMSTFTLQQRKHQASQSDVILRKQNSNKLLGAPIWSFSCVVNQAPEVKLRCHGLVFPSSSRLQGLGS